MVQRVRVAGRALRSFQAQGHIKLQAGTALHSAIAEVRTRRVAAVVTGTVITAVTDLKTGAINSTITPGRDVKISGVKLRVAGKEPEVGLYFVPETGDPVKVDITDIMVNNPSKLITLTAGTYRVRIVTQYSTHKPLKVPHLHLRQTPHRGLKRNGASEAARGSVLNNKAARREPRKGRRTE